MEPFKRVEAVAVSFAVPNVDTDQIIPARFLWHKQSDGYGQFLFNDLRFGKDGVPEAGFFLNEPANQGAKILIGGENFGCGSSREQAVWALYDYGFRVVIAPSFGDIFFNNAFKQGLLPVVLPEVEMARLRDALETGNSREVSVDLENRSLSAAGLIFQFAIAPFRRKQLLEGLDEIGMTLRLLAEISAFEARFDHAMPWLEMAAR